MLALHEALGPSVTSHLNTELGLDINAVAAVVPQGRRRKHTPVTPPAVGPVVDDAAAKPGINIREVRSKVHGDGSGKLGDGKRESKSLKIDAFDLKSFGVIPPRGPRPFRASRTGVMPKIPLIPAGKRPLISAPFNFVHRRHVAPEDVPSVFRNTDADEPLPLPSPGAARRLLPDGDGGGSGDELAGASQYEEQSPRVRVRSTTPESIDSGPSPASPKTLRARPSSPAFVYNSEDTNSDDEFFGFRDGNGAHDAGFDDDAAGFGDEAPVQGRAEANSHHSMARRSTARRADHRVAPPPPGDADLGVPVYIALQVQQTERAKALITYKATLRRKEQGPSLQERLAAAEQAKAASRAAIEAIVSVSSESEAEEEVVSGFQVHYSRSSTE